MAVNKRKRKKIIYHKGEKEKIVNISDQIKCPKCSRMSRVVWVSKDGKTAGVQCPATHSQLSRPTSKLGSKSRPQSKSCRNMVFLVSIA